MLHRGDFCYRGLACIGNFFRSPLRMDTSFLAPHTRGVLVFVGTCVGTQICFSSIEKPVLNEYLSLVRKTFKVFTQCLSSRKLSFHFIEFAKSVDEVFVSVNKVGMNRVADSLHRFTWNVCEFLKGFFFWVCHVNTMRCHVGATTNRCTVLCVCCNRTILVE
jgi:hypothetical protein